MGFIKKGGLLFAILLLIPISVLADFDVKFEATDSTITFGQLAEFKLTVTNNLNTKETFKVKTLDYPLWEIKTDPIMNPIQFSINPKETNEIELFVNPLHISNYGIYDVTVIVELVSKKEKIETPLRVGIVSPQAGTYVETVLATITIDEHIDPTKEIPIKITLNNQNPIEYPNLIIKLDSKVIKEEIKESLGKKEKKTITLSKTISPQTPPQEDTLVLNLISNEKTLDTKVKRIEIIAHKELSKDEKVNDRFLKAEKKITFTNIGNVKYEENVKIETSLIRGLFTSSNPKGKMIKEDEQRYMVIPVNLSPGESISITVTQNYITLLVLGCFGIIITILYYMLRSPLTLKKSAANVSFREGGVSELKVVLNITNRSKEKLYGIEIIDRIPNIADLEKGLTIGTLHPTKILKHEKKGTIIKWVIDELDTGDERVISYKIKSHLSILGQFSLSQAIAKFKFDGRDVISHSNILGVNP
ncbi:MAG: hypothetical protein KKC75_06060 [Nanoarchaeota archaeon]|nr:hypothetical protein [Nanoarchaeota archaeon]MBU1004710.1 hypothetical protein [Nanoarchaeota archaeon]MBU1945756.1 hypothetical protein [Nanoarchaeota archaeon]